MDVDTVRRYCLSFPQATEGIQWGHDLLFRVGGKIFAQRAAVGLLFIGDSHSVGQQSSGRQIGGAHGVIKTLAGNRIDQAGRVANRHPAVAGHAVLFPGPGL